MLAIEGYKRSQLNLPAKEVFSRVIPIEGHDPRGMPSKISYLLSRSRVI